MKLKKIRALTNIQKAYLAGFVDGEGCITISKKKDYKRMKFGYSFRPHVNVANTNEPVLKMFIRWTGLGNVCFSSQSKRHNRKDKFQWQLWSQQARQVVEAILPYLRVKRKQADVLLEFIKHSRRSPGRRGLSSAEWRRQHRLNGIIKLLNKKGRPIT